MIALLALKGMIKPSRVFLRFHRDFRKIVRLRHFLVRKRTDIKNRIHGILDSELFQLSNVLTDILGKSGIHIMRGILEGKSPDEVLESIHTRVRERKEEEIRVLLEQNLSIYALLQLRHCLRVMKQLDDEIELLRVPHHNMQWISIVENLNSYTLFPGLEKYQHLLSSQR